MPDTHNASSVGATYMTTDRIPQIPDDPALRKIQQLGKKIPTVPADLPEPSLSENAWYIGRTRYAMRDENGEPVETAKQMFWRIAYNIATADRYYLKPEVENGKRAIKESEEDREKAEALHIKTARQFYRLLASQQFIANTPTMVNAGKENQQLSACFVLPVEDSLEGILKTSHDMAMIHKSGGGTGFSFSRLRPKDDIIQSSRGKTTGPVQFMQMYNDMTSSIRQGGVRRGANMGILHYTHPDVLLFAIYKVEEFSLTNFNISVTVDEAFFEQVKADAKHLPEGYESEFDFEGFVEEVKEAHRTRDVDLKLVLLDGLVKRLQEWCKETDTTRGYELVNPRTGEVVGRLNAKKLYDLITRLAHNYGDPGMIMMDRINNSRANPTPQLGMIEATNPCGEQPLLPYDACTLGSINLAKFVKPGPSGRNEWDFDGLKKAVHQSIHFLDNVLDMNEYPLDEVRRMTRAIRRIGLGIMGFADALLAMNIGYNSAEGIHAAEEVMRFVQKEADNASIDLAKSRGAFPAFEGSYYDKPGEIKPRNGARTTIAPTGTISMLADCSSGCEPLFALTYAKNTIEGKRIFQTSPYFVAALKERGLYSEDLLEKIQKNGGSVQGLDEIPGDLQKVFVVAGDITPSEHIKIQAAFQRYVDNAISKTINFPNSATVQDVRDAYWQAYETGCKGITIYRDGSREKQILETKKEKSYYDKLAGGAGASAGKEVPTAVTPSVFAATTAVPEADAQVPIALRPRPHVLTGKSYKMATPVGSAFITINEDEHGNIFELFINIGHAGSDIMADAEAMGRLITLAFRIPSLYSSDRIAQNVAESLAGIGGASSAGFGQQRVRSLADAVARVLREHEATKRLVKQHAEELAKKLTLEGQADSSDKTNTHTNGLSNGHATVAPLTDVATALQIGASQMSMDKVLATAAPAPSNADFCPDCGLATLRFVEGCQKCENCGFSKC
jgi:ribonucleoside-diphosphate reductase alpha chain